MKIYPSPSVGDVRYDSNNLYLVVDRDGESNNVCLLLDTDNIDSQHVAGRTYIWPDWACDDMLYDTK